MKNQKSKNYVLKKSLTLLALKKISGIQATKIVGGKEIPASIVTPNIMLILD